MVLTHIEPISLAKVYAVVYGLMGLLIGLPAGCFFALVGSQVSDAGPLAGVGFAAVIIYPIMFAIMGFIGGLIFAFIYNLVAGWVGGVEVEFDGMMAHGDIL